MSRLALLGGSPVVTQALPIWPQATDQDLKALLSADPTRRNGPLTHALAARFATFCDVPYCVPVANGTVSLELILRALNIGPGDEVILPAYTFIATLSSILYAGATPVFADIEPDTYNLSLCEAEKKITDRTKAVVGVAIGGQPFDVEGFSDMAKAHGIHLIVDAAQAVGARISGKSIGAYGSAASFSCQNTKNLTAGEGGFITTHDPVLYERLLSLIGEKDLPGYPNFGHSMTEMQAALLNSQMDALPEQINRRSSNAALLDSLLASNPLFSPMKVSPSVEVHAYHLYRLRINVPVMQSYQLSKQDILEALQAEGLGIAGGYNPLYRNPAVKKLKLASSIPLPVSDYAADKEGLWMVQETLLSGKERIYQVAEAFRKVADNLEELRDYKKQKEQKKWNSLKQTTKPGSYVEEIMKLAQNDALQSLDEWENSMQQILNSGTWGTIGPVEKAVSKWMASQEGYRYAVLTHSYEAAIQTAVRALEVPFEQYNPEIYGTEEFLNLLIEKGLVVSDYGVCGAIFTDSRSLYEEVFAHHYCGHWPEEDAASPNPDSEDIIGGDMRITEWQALAVLWKHNGKTL